MQILILILATWRITSLLHTEHGPFDVFGRLRDLIGIRLDDAGNWYGANELARLVNCPWCLSLWIAGILTGIDRIYRIENISCLSCPSLFDWVLLALTVSAGAVIVNEVVEWLEQAPLRS